VELEKVYRIVGRDFQKQTKVKYTACPVVWDINPKCAANPNTGGNVSCTNRIRSAFKHVFFAQADEGAVGGVPNFVLGVLGLVFSDIFALVIFVVVAKV
jgi:hypothetical protein